MELADCDFGNLQRDRWLSRCAMCEGFQLCSEAVRRMHGTNVLHRDIKLNNLAFCIDNRAAATRSSDLLAMAETTIEADNRVSARVLDLGEARLVNGDRGWPTDAGACRSIYKSVSRHRREQQGYKIDVEMLLYVFPDKLMACGQWCTVE